MSQRRISEQEVRATIIGYHTRYRDFDGNHIYIGRPGGRRIKVVVEKDSDPPHVITVAD